MVHTRPGETIVDTRWGPMVCFANDTGVSEALRRFGEYGIAEAELYHRLLGDGGTFLDVGANIGALSFGLASLATQRRVLAFEPQRTYFEAALTNLRRFPNAVAFPLALSDHEGLIDIPEIPLDRVGNYGSLSLSNKHQTDRWHPVACVSIDGLLRRQGVVPNLIKIDVEGMERQVLAGAAETLRTAAPILSVEVDRRESGAGVVELLISCGYRVYLALFRAVSKANAKFDTRSRHCRILHVHAIGFAGVIPEWWQKNYRGSEIRSGAEYLASFDRKFP